MCKEAYEKKAKRSYRKSAVTREKVYRAAIELMEKNGFQGTTIRDICERANVSIGTFYSYFKTKTDVLSDIYLSADNYFTDVVSAELEGKSVYEKLEIFVRHYARLNLNTGLDTMRVLFNPENSWFSVPRQMQKQLLEIIEEGQRSGEIRGDVKSTSLVGVIFDLMRGICYSWCINEGSFDLEMRMSFRFGLLLDGIKTK